MSDNAYQVGTKVTVNRGSLLGFEGIVIAEPTGPDYATLLPGADPATAIRVAIQMFDVEVLMRLPPSMLDVVTR